jgi:hypothetical protein
MITPFIEPAPGCRRTQGRWRDQHLAEGEQRVRQDLPGRWKPRGRRRRATAAASRRRSTTARKRDAGRHPPQRRRLPAEAAQRGYSTRLLNGIRIITSSGLSACICAGLEPRRLGHAHRPAAPRWRPSGRTATRTAWSARTRSGSQHRAHAVDRLVRVAAARALELQRQVPKPPKPRSATRSRGRRPRRSPTGMRNTKDARPSSRPSPPAQARPRCPRARRAARAHHIHEGIRVRRRHGTSRSGGGPARTPAWRSASARPECRRRPCRPVAPRSKTA